MQICRKWVETLHKWRNLLSLMKNLSLQYPSHVFMVLQSLNDSMYIAFKGILCGDFVHLAIHHIESTSFETFHASLNHCVLIRKLNFGHWWFTTEKFLQFSYVSRTLPVSFMFLNFWKFANLHELGWDFAQMIESVIVHEKSQFGVPCHILVVLQGVKDFTYIAFKGLIYGNFVDLAIHHIEWTSFETFHASSNHWLLIRKLSLGHFWLTTEKFLEFACGFNNLPASLMLLNFWKFSNSNKIGWDFAQMIKSDVVDEKT